MPNAEGMRFAYGDGSLPGPATGQWGTGNSKSSIRLGSSEVKQTSSQQIDNTAKTSNAPRARQKWHCRDPNPMACDLALLFILITRVSNPLVA